MKRGVLCFDVSKNGKKLTLAGLQESGVISIILSWQGSRPGASRLAAAAKRRIPGLHFHVGGIDSSNPAGDDNVGWIQEERDFRLGDEIRIRLSAMQTPDVPVRKEPSKRRGRRLPAALHRHRRRTGGTDFRDERIQALTAQGWNQMLTDLLLEVVFKVGLMAVAFLIVFVPITVLTWIVTEWRKWRDRSGK